MTQKPSSVQLKDFLITKTSQELDINEDIVDRVISWSYEQANKATLVHSEIEFSGFGNVFISQNKIKRRKSRLEEIRDRIQKKFSDPELTEAQIINYEKKLSNLNSVLELYQSKLVDK